MRTPLREEQFWLLTGGVLLLAFVAFSFAMFFTRSFMIPFVFSIFLCAMVSPVEKLVVVRWKLPRWTGFVSSFLVILMVFILCFFLARFAINSITNAIEEVNRSGETSTLEKFEMTLDLALKQVGIGSYIEAETLLKEMREQIPSFLKDSLNVCKNFVSSSTLVFLFCLFILLGRDPHTRVQNEIYAEIERSIQKYLNIKFFISLATGICVYLIFFFLGTHMAFLFGLIAFVLNFIPSIGSIIATIIPIPILILTSEMTNTQLILAMVLPTCVQQFFGNLLEPKLQGLGLQLHPVTILLALGFFGVVWGPVGMLLAAPITAALRIILLEFKMTQWMAQLMAGNLPNMQRTIISEIDFSEGVSEDALPAEFQNVPETSVISTTITGGMTMMQTTVPVLNPGNGQRECSVTARTQKPSAEKGKKRKKKK
ncbi:MAG: AI-2E family transporter [Planctomycetaceae bacterium]|nr:AI-2E family transporter [Planctomycetaceae bacterium]